jgi:hypothetical protein
VQARQLLDYDAIQAATTIGEFDDRFIAPVRALTYN